MQKWQMKWLIYFLNGQNNGSDTYKHEHAIEWKLISLQDIMNNIKIKI